MEIGGAQSNVTGVLIRRELCVQREEDVNTQGEGGRQGAKERGLQQIPSPPPLEEANPADTLALDVQPLERRDSKAWSLKSLSRGVISQLPAFLPPMINGVPTPCWRLHEVLAIQWGVKINKVPALTEVTFSLGRQRRKRQHL